MPIIWSPPRSINSEAIKAIKAIQFAFRGSAAMASIDFDRRG
jgi:hypothetical protein